MREHGDTEARNGTTDGVASAAKRGYPEPETSMTTEQRAAWYAERVKRAILVDFESHDEWQPECDDETKTMVILMNTLRRLADEAEARIAMKLQIDDILGSG